MSGKKKFIVALLLLPLLVILDFPYTVIEIAEEWHEWYQSIIKWYKNL
jgi:hypothetical protein